MNTYTMQQYGKQPEFAGFLPGIAGEKGIPIWCYYVNRGQGVVSFGVDNKDHAIMEFLPAHRAYTRVRQTGFRTFVRVNGAFSERFIHEDKGTEELPPKNTPVDTVIRSVYEASRRFWGSEMDFAMLLGYIDTRGKVTLFGGARDQQTVTLTPEDKLIVFSNH